MNQRSRFDPSELRAMVTRLERLIAEANRTVGELKAAIEFAEVHSVAIPVELRSDAESVELLSGVVSGAAHPAGGSAGVHSVGAAPRAQLIEAAEARSDVVSAGVRSDMASAPVQLDITSAVVRPDIESGQLAAEQPTARRHRPPVREPAPTPWSRRTVVDTPWSQRTVRRRPAPANLSAEVSTSPAPQAIPLPAGPGGAGTPPRQAAPAFAGSDAAMPAGNGPLGSTASSEQIRQATNILAPKAFSPPADVPPPGPLSPDAGERVAVVIDGGPCPAPPLPVDVPESAVARQQPVDVGAPEAVSLSAVGVGFAPVPLSEDVRGPMPVDVEEPEAPSLPVYVQQPESASVPVSMERLESVAGYGHECEVVWPSAAELEPETAPLPVYVLEPETVQIPACPDVEMSRSRGGSTDAVTPRTAVELAAQHGLDIVGFDGSNVDTYVVREVLAAVDDMLTRYPIALRGIRITDPDDSAPAVRGLSSAPPQSDASAMWMVLDGEALANLVPAAGSVRTRRWLRRRRNADRPVYAAVVREFGCALDVAGDFRARHEAQRRLTTESLLGKVNLAYNPLDPGLALLDAFTDVALHGDRAGQLAQELHDMLVKMARAESTDLSAERIKR